MPEIPSPPLLEQKALGIANEFSIAFGCAPDFRKLGAELAITYLNDKARPYVEPLARELQPTIFLPLDVQQAGMADKSLMCRRGAPAVPRSMAKQQPPQTRVNMKRKKYEEELRKLQTELCKLQEWVVHKRLRVILVFEGRDAAGKGGTIKAITERVSPRVFRVVALPAPSDREKTQLYIQRYIPHFPAAGEVIIFDRSWYNRAGVEYVMNFCSKEQYQGFVENCPKFENHIVQAGIILVKFWLEVGQEEQQRRFKARIEDPLRQWKLSPMDLESYAHWYAYSRARDMMLEATDTEGALWHIVRSDDKRRARLNCIAHFLSLIPCEDVPRDKVKLPARLDKGEYDDQATLKGRNFVPEIY